MIRNDKFSQFHCRFSYFLSFSYPAFSKYILTANSRIPTYVARNYITGGDLKRYFLLLVRHFCHTNKEFPSHQNSCIRISVHINLEILGYQIDYIGPSTNIVILDLT